MARWTIDHFEKQYNDNCEAAINYYEQREKNLINIYSKQQKVNLDIEEIEKKMIDEVWNKLNEEFQKRAEEILEIKDENGNYKFWEFNSRNHKKFREDLTEDELEDLASKYGISLKNFKESFKQGKQTFAQIEGFIKEYFIEAVINNYLLKGQGFIENTINNMIKDIKQAGSATTVEGGSRRKGAPLSVDVGVGLLQSGNPEKGIPELEIPGNLLIDLKERQYIKKTKEESIEKLLENYLTKEDLIKRYGIQVKRFPDSSSFDYRT